MAQEAAESVGGRLLHPVLLEQISPGLFTGWLEIDMRAAAPVAGGGLRHEGDEQAVPLGDLLQQHAQEGEAVGHGEDVGIAEVELELRIGALRDDILDAPAEPVEDVHDLAEEADRIEYASTS